MRIMAGAYSRVIGMIAMLCCIVLISSCSKKSLTKSFIVSESSVEVTSSSANAVDIVREEFSRLDKIVNANNPQSEISLLNGTHNKAIKASPDLLEILTLSQQANDLTVGAFDVSCAAVSDYWKNSFERGNIKDMPLPSEITSHMDKCGAKNIIIDAAQSTVTLAKEGLKIDLSAISTGFMIDKAIWKLKSQGIKSARIDVDGRAFCLGTNENGPWNVDTKDNIEVEGAVSGEALIDEAVATIRGRGQTFKIGQNSYSRTIDPRTGYPVSNNVLSVSVITQNCTTADSMAHAVFVMGLDEARGFLSRVPSTMRVFVITSDDAHKTIHILR